MKNMFKIKNQLNIIFSLVIYYFLLLNSLIYVSWIFWSKFIRERTIREIPDYLLTEYRFWILIYLCTIYIYTIKSLVKPKDKVLIPPEFIEYFYRPLTLLDRVFKYNKYMKNYYNEKSKEVVTILNNLSDKNLIIFIFAIRIIPRIILSLFLLCDTFYFHKLEIFYKVILLGLLPFIFRYIKHSIKDIYNYWIEVLENHYNYVFVFEKDYEYDVSRIKNTNAKYHYKKIPIKEFMDLQYETDLENCLNKINYTYVGDPYAQDHVIETYAISKYNDQDAKLTSEDYDIISELFNKLYPLIIKLKTFVNRIKTLEDKPLTKYSRISIYSIYFICWSYILITSYYHYPIDLPMFKYLIKNLTIYMQIYDLDPFLMLYQHSINENLITPENICNLLKSILNKVIKIIKNFLS